MEALAHDLSLALQESSKELQQTVRRHNRKRKGKVRRNSNGPGEDMSLYNSVDFPNRSEASAGSDLDSILRAQHVSQHVNVTPRPMHPIPRHLKTLSPAVEGTTDSEDQCSRIANRLSSLTLPANNSLVSGGDLESDSVNEIAIERKTTDHARRRRRAKLNASPSIVVGSLPDERPFTPENERKFKPRPHSRKKDSSMDTEQLSGDKKYKSHKMDSEPISGYIPMLNADTGYYDISSESSHLTSDGGETCDDQAGEADDEQSDFFHEFDSGPTYGIPTKSRNMMLSEHNDQTPTNRLHLQGIIHQSFPNYSHSSKLKRTKYGKYGRPIRTGYRRLRSSNKMQSSSVPYQSSSEQDCFLAPSSLTYSSDNKSPKRRRQFITHASNSSSLAGNKSFSDLKSYSIQIPSSMNWAVGGSQDVNRVNNATNLFSNSPSYRSSNTNSTSIRRRRRAVINNSNGTSHSLPHKKSGST